MSTATLGHRTSRAITRRRVRRRRLAVLLPVALLVALGGSLLARAGGNRLRSPEPAAASSALVGDGVTVSPAPGARYSSPQTEISFLGIERRELGDVHVVGSRSGVHRGRLVGYAATRGASFVPEAPFDSGERVTVTAAKAHVSYSFRTATRAPLTGDVTPPPAPKASTTHSYSFASAPTIRPPQVQVNTNATGADGGDIFVAPIGANGVPTYGDTAPMILTSSGSLVWEGTLPPGDEAMDLHPQTYRGKPVLTWWQGRVSQYGFGIGEDVIVDSSYHPIATVRAGNGETADLHEFQITRQGTALISAFRPVSADLSTYHGPKDGVVLDSVIQQIDIKTGRVMFEWNPLDHLSLRDSYTTPASSGPWDAFHVNSVDVGSSGDLLITARNTWAAYDVDPRTGQIAWEVGGKHSSYRLSSDDIFAWEHDIRFQPNGEISVFDDEGDPRSTQSRALMLRLDGSTGRARAVARYTHNPKLVSPSQGNTETLPNGNIFVGWGAGSYYSEYTPSGRLVYDARLPGPDVSYRSFRAEWVGHPTGNPSIAVRSSKDSATVYASWNGATKVARWDVVAGPSASQLSPVATAARSGFETAITVKGRARYYAIQAVSATGAVLGTSRVERG